MQQGQLDDCKIKVLHTGVGETICRQRMATFLQEQQFNYLISAGFAGALNDGLHVGDLLLAENFWTIKQSEVRSALSTLPIHTGSLLTVSSMIDSGTERERIGQTTGANALDMETEFIARACAEHAVPLLSLRVISDTPSEPFPAPGHILFNIAKQRTNLAKLSVFFLQHPSRTRNFGECSRENDPRDQIIPGEGAEVLSRVVVRRTHYSVQCAGSM